MVATFLLHWCCWCHCVWELWVLLLSKFFFMTLLRTSTLSVTFSLLLPSSSPVVLKKTSRFSTKPVLDSMDVALKWPLLSFWWTKVLQVSIFHPSIFFHSSGAGSWCQQAQQNSPDVPLPSNFIHFSIISAILGCVFDFLLANLVTLKPWKSHGSPVDVLV